jgi:hypothetical protein
MRVADLLTKLGLSKLLPLFEAKMVDIVGVLALMTREDYADLKVPKRAALRIMAECNQLMDGQQ